MTSPMTPEEVRLWDCVVVSRYAFPDDKPHSIISEHSSHGVICRTGFTSQPNAEVFAFNAAAHTDAIISERRKRLPAAINHPEIPVSSTAPKVPEGWRILEENELLVSGDKGVLRNGGAFWFEVKPTLTGRKQDKDFIYRRRDTEGGAK